MDDSAADQPPAIPIIVPHADHSDAECCGCLMPVVRGDEADLVCNECGAVIGTVAAGEVEQTLLRMAMSEGIYSETCPICGDLNTFPGFTSIVAYTCRHCGESVAVPSSIQ